jgi:hypothetical protein
MGSQVTLVRPDAAPSAASAEGSLRSHRAHPHCREQGAIRHSIEIDFPTPRMAS